MPDFCAAYGCSNERNDKTKQQGITFHRFPNNKLRRQTWTAALRRKGFEPKHRTVICSCHFKPEDFDRTGQTTRLKGGAIPSVFKFPDRLSKLPSTSRLSRTSEKATVECPCPQSHSPVRGLGGLNLSKESVADHHYAFDPVKAKHKMAEAQKTVEKLRRDLRNAKDREKRHNERVKSLLQDLKEKQTVTKELQQKLDLYSGLPAETFKRQDAFTPA